MEASKSEITVRFAGEIDQLATVEPLWNALQEHHSKLTPNLGGGAPKRELGDSNADFHRFYERHGFTQGFVIYYGKRAAPDVQD